MGAVDRVMVAYEQKYILTDEQALIIRAEVSKFIDHLLAGGQSRSEANAMPNAPNFNSIQP